MPNTRHLTHNSPENVTAKGHLLPHAQRILAVARYLAGLGGCPVGRVGGWPVAGPAPRLDSAGLALAPPVPRSRSTPQLRAPPADARAQTPQLRTARPVGAAAALQLRTDDSDSDAERRNCAVKQCA